MFAAVGGLILGASTGSVASAQDAQQAATDAALKKCLTDNPVGIPPMGKSLAQVEQICHFTAQQGNRKVVVRNQSGYVLRDIWSNNGVRTTSGSFTLGTSDTQMLDGSRRNEVFITWHAVSEKSDQWPIVGSSPPSVVDGPCHLVIPSGSGTTTITVTGQDFWGPNAKCTVQ